MNEIIETTVSLNAEEICLMIRTLFDKAEELSTNEEGYLIINLDEATRQKRKEIFATIAKLRKGLDKIEEAEAKAA